MRFSVAAMLCGAVSGLQTGRLPAPKMSAAASPMSTRLLELVAPTDRGIDCTAEQRNEISSLIEALEASQVGADAFASDNLCRRTEVAYVGQTSSKNANAAGGKYRGRLGRLLFQTDALFQHVLEENVAVNVVRFRLFGLLQGCAVLPGKWSRLPATELGDRGVSKNAVRVAFDQPRVAFGRLLNLQLGPTSEVTLDTTYLDDNVRISRGGSSGVPFVFRADTCRDGAPLEAASTEWEAVAARRPLGKRSLVPTLLAGALGCWRVGRGGLSVARVLAVALAAAAAALLRSTGGIVVDGRGRQEDPADAEGIPEAADAKAAPPAATPRAPPPRAHGGSGGSDVARKDLGQRASRASRVWCAAGELRV